MLFPETCVIAHEKCADTHASTFTRGNLSHVQNHSIFTFGYVIIIYSL